MTQAADPQLRDLLGRADEVAALLKQLANARRLMILCRLAEGEATVTELCAVADLSPSAMSQHLAKMKAEGLLQAKKDGLQVHYSLSDRRCMELLGHLKSAFCDPTAFERA